MAGTASATQIVLKDGRVLHGKLGKVASLADGLVEAIHTLEHAQHAAHEAGSVHEEARAFVDHVIPAQNALRVVADELESLVADDLWPLPKYRELLFQF